MTESRLLQVVLEVKGETQLRNLAAKLVEAGVPHKLWCATMHTTLRAHLHVLQHLFSFCSAADAAHVSNNLPLTGPCFTLFI